MDAAERAGKEALVRRLGLWANDHVLEAEYCHDEAALLLDEARRVPRWRIGRWVQLMLAASKAQGRTSAQCEVTAKAVRELKDLLKELGEDDED